MNRRDLIFLSYIKSLPSVATLVLGTLLSLLSLLSLPALSQSTAKPVIARVDLPGDVFGIQVLRRTSAPTSRDELLIFDRDRRQEKPGTTQQRDVMRYVSRWTKTSQDPRLTSVGRWSLPTNVAAYAACALQINGPEQLLLLHSHGVDVMTLDAKPSTPRLQQLIEDVTLFAHSRDDGLVALELCMPLFAGEGPAIVLPTLHGVSIWRQKTPGHFQKVADISSRAELRFMGTFNRDAPPPSQELAPQRVSVAFSFPDVSAFDVNGDGRLDLCFTRDDELSCYWQQATQRFNASPDLIKRLDLLTADEQNAGNTRVQVRLLDLNRDGRMDLLVQKAVYNLSAMGGEIQIFMQSSRGQFPAQPNQVIKRTGFFVFHEFFDLDQDGFIDIVAPVAETGWSALASMYLTKTAQLEFIWYKNTGVAFDTLSRPLYEMEYPMSFRHWQSILGSLPIWNVRLGLQNAAAGREVLFFPEQTTLELFTIKNGADMRGVRPRWRYDIDLGTANQVADLDGDGREELYSTYPRDAKRSRQLLMVEIPSF